MSELPKGWMRVNVGQIAQQRSEPISPPARPEAACIGLEHHVAVHTNEIIGTVPASSMSSSAVCFEQGDVLYGQMRPYLNKRVAESLPTSNILAETARKAELAGMTLELLEDLLRDES